MFVYGCREYKMNGYLLSQIYVEMSKYRAHHTDTQNEYQAFLVFQYNKTPRPSLWDATLFNAGNLLVSLGERLRRNRGSLRLSEDCQ